MLELRIASSQREKPAKTPPVRWSRLVLGAIGCVACAGVAVSARRVWSTPRRAQPLAARVEPSAARNAQPGAAEAVSMARDRLEEFEAERRRTLDFAHLPPGNRSHGADPYALAALDAQHFLGVLRGASALVLLDARLHELQRLEVPGAAVSLAVSDSGEIWVAGEASPVLSRFRFDGRRLSLAGQLNLPGILGIRALAAGPRGTLYALDVRDGQLLTLDTTRAAKPVREVRRVGHGPLSLRRVGELLIVDLLLDHALVVYRVNARGSLLEERARVHHDGPIWGFDAAALSDGRLLLVAAGVEDHPLDRSQGFFGYVDSF